MKIKSITIVNKKNIIFNHITLMSIKQLILSIYFDLIVIRMYFVKKYAIPPI